MIDNSGFLVAKRSLEADHLRYNIGTYKERSQHLLLKHLYEPDISYHEVPVEGYVADILNDEGITEIQTAAFRALNEKLAVFLPRFPVRIVYPVCDKKRIIWTDPQTGESEMGRYTSYPRARFRILSELLSIVDHFGAPGFCIEIVLLKSSQFKLRDGYGNDNKRKATKLDTVPDELIGTLVLRDASDVRSFLPLEIGSRVTVTEISKVLGLRRIPLWRAIKFLAVLEILVPVDKKGKSIIYEISEEKF